MDRTSRVLNMWENKIKLKKFWGRKYWEPMTYMQQ